MVIKLIEDKEIWDDLVDKSPYGLLFHKMNFLNIMAKYSGCKLLPYGIYKGNELVAIFPLFFMNRKNILRGFFSPPPRTGVPYLGFVMEQKYDLLKQDKKENYINIMVDDFNGENKKCLSNYVNISTVPNFVDIRAFKWSEYSVIPHYTYIVDLSSSLENIWNGMHGQYRNFIKKTENRVTIEKSENVKAFYEMMTNRYNDQGINSPLASSSYLEDIFKNFKDNMSLFFAYDDNEIVVGALLTIFYKKRYIAWLGAVKPKDNIYANEYLIWKSLEIAKKEKYEKYEILGAEIKRLCLFKSKFNPSLEIFFHISKKDATGRLSEWVYFNCLKKRRI